MITISYLNDTDRLARKFYAPSPKKVTVSTSTLETVSSVSKYLSNSCFVFLMLVCIIVFTIKLRRSDAPNLAIYCAIAEAVFNLAYLVYFCVHLFAKRQRNKYAFSRLYYMDQRVMSNNIRYSHIDIINIQATMIAAMSDSGTQIPYLNRLFDQLSEAGQLLKEARDAQIEDTIFYAKINDIITNVLLALNRAFIPGRLFENATEKVLITNKYELASARTLLSTLEYSSAAS